MRIKRLSRRFKDPIYRSWWIVIACDPKEFASKIEKSIKSWKPTTKDAKEILDRLQTLGLDCLDDYNGRTYALTNFTKGYKLIVIWLRAGARVSTVFHEAYHGARNVTAARGVQLDGIDEEAMAYYLSFVTDNILGDV